MICPTVSVNILCFNNLLTLFWESLASSNCCLISSWSSFHLLCLDQWRCDGLWFFRFFFIISFLRKFKVFFGRSWFFNWFILRLLNNFLLYWNLSLLFLCRNFRNFWSAFCIGFGNRLKISLICSLSWIGDFSSWSWELLWTTGDFLYLTGDFMVLSPWKLLTTFYKANRDF